FNEFKFGINRSPFLNPQASVLPFSVSTNSFEALNNNNTDHEIGTTFSFVDNLVISRGRNTFKTGIEVRRVRLNQGITADYNYNFTDNLSLINNQLDSVQDRNSWCCRGLRHTLVMPYVQDEWRVRPNLTLNLGLRWEYYSVITEAHGRMTVFDLACGGICPAGSPAYFPYHKNFDPRVGIAWAPKALHDKTVVRAGFGIYSGMGQNDDLNAALESNTTRFAISSADVAGGILPFPVDPNAFPSGTFLAPRALYRHRRDMYVEEYGLSIQQLLPSNFVFQSSYIGSHGVRLFARSYVNLCEQPFDGTNCVRPLPNFSQVDIKYNNGTSHFDGLELSLQRRMASGWMWTTQYMWSHSLNDGSVGGGEANAPENVQCQRCDYGPSVFDVRHNLVMASTYELPFGRGHTLLGSGAASNIFGGWTLSGVGVFHTGHPLTVLMGVSGSQVPDGNFRSNERPDLVPGVPLAPPGGQTANDWVNINAFVMPPVDANGVITHFGNAPNGVVRAPNVWEMDLAIQKSIRLTERAGLEFRAEAFNVFNHTQYGDPNNLDILSPSNFGQINTTVNYNTNNDNFAPPNTGMGLPRQLQLMLRIKF
ncbi:MAG: TonB-dependent receptor, partial [Acidobacteriaceae bacterium]|nr:TonB-dependent receptor [Acidobacteriaceae bacterium]